MILNLCLGSHFYCPSSASLQDLQDTKSLQEMHIFQTYTISFMLVQALVAPGLVEVRFFGNSWLRVWKTSATVMRLSYNRALPLRVSSLNNPAGFYLLLKSKRAQWLMLRAYYKFESYSVS